MKTQPSNCFFFEKSLFFNFEQSTLQILVEQLSEFKELMNFCPPEITRTTSFLDNFGRNKSLLICLNSLNIRREVWRGPLLFQNAFLESDKLV